MTKNNSIILRKSLDKEINSSVETTKKIVALSKEINNSINLIVKKIKDGGKILLCGNGGSAADAQHLTAEMLIRLRPNKNRNPIPAVCLTMDSSTITACSNDYNFSKIFSRPLEAIGKKNDILIIFSTSGNSKNIIEVLKSSKKKKIFSIGFLGSGGGKAKKYCNIKLIINSNQCNRIQECHKFLSHFIAYCVEEKLFLKKNKIKKNFK